jgi:hypothetical protein
MDIAEDTLLWYSHHANNDNATESIESGTESHSNNSDGTMSDSLEDQEYSDGSTSDTKEGCGIQQNDLINNIMNVL